ncbi:MAG: hypothetical protein WCX97_05465 [Candidatus Magasanikbacteria bacterium]
MRRQADPDHRFLRVLRPFAVGKTNKYGIAMGDIRRKLEGSEGKDFADAVSIRTGCGEKFIHFPVMKEYSEGVESFGAFDFLVKMPQKETDMLDMGIEFYPLRKDDLRNIKTTDKEKGKIMFQWELMAANEIIDR